MSSSTSPVPHASALPLCSRIVPGLLIDNNARQRCIHRQSLRISSQKPHCWSPDLRRLNLSRTLQTSLVYFAAGGTTASLCWADGWRTAVIVCLWMWCSDHCAVASCCITFSDSFQRKKAPGRHQSWATILKTNPKTQHPRRPSTCLGLRVHQAFQLASIATLLPHRLSRALTEPQASHCLKRCYVKWPREMARRG